MVDVQVGEFLVNVQDGFVRENRYERALFHAGHRCASSRKLVCKSRVESMMTPYASVCELVDVHDVSEPPGEGESQVLKAWSLTHEGEKSP